MDIMSSTKGASDGYATAKTGMVVTVDAYKCDDEDLNEWMDKHDDGVGMVISSIDEDADLLWVEGCPYAIEPWIVWKDR